MFSKYRLQLRKALILCELLQNRSSSSQGATIRSADSAALALDIGNHANPVSYDYVLRRCSSLKAFRHGMRVHDCIVRAHLEGDESIQYKLIHMYAGCGDVQTAHALFIRCNKQRSVFMWNVIIRGYVHVGQYEVALHSFKQMLCEGTAFDNFTLVFVVSACACRRSLTEGKQLHIHISSSGLISDLLVSNALLSMYAKCGNLDEVKMIFVDMPERNTVTWTSMMDACLQHGLNEYVFQLWVHMRGEGEFPDKICFLTILSACSVPATLSHGKQTHIGILEAGCMSDVYLGTALINMYGNCGNYADAYKVFAEIPVRNVVSWNSIIALAAQSRGSNDAIQLFHQMVEEGLIPDRVTFIHALTACMRQGALHLGRQLHVSALCSVSPLDVMLGTTVMNMYGKCGSLDESFDVFDSLCNRNLVSWNVLLGVLTDHGKIEMIFRMFCEMQQEVIPDKFTFVNLLDTCCSTIVLVDGELLHVYIVELGLESDDIISTALITMYGKCSGLEAAYCVFTTMPKRNVVSWNAMITICSHKGKCSDAFQLFGQMNGQGILPDTATFLCVLDACMSEGMTDESALLHSYIVEMCFDSDVTVCNTLINIYGKLKSLEDALQVFRRLNTTDVMSWTAVVAGYVQHGCFETAIQLFETFHSSNLLAAKETFLAILDAYSNVFELTKGKLIYSSIVCKGLDSDAAVATALVNMYGKCGNPEVAWKVFELAKKKDVILWTAIITVHAQHGYGQEAQQLFAQMLSEGVSPNNVTFVNVLTACSHAGLIHEGRYFFDSIVTEDGTPPLVDHYDCLIDLFGRAGLLDEAEYLINGMPYQPRIVSFMALLGACRDDLQKGARIAKSVFDLNPEISAPFVMLSNIIEKSYVMCRMT